LGIGRSLKYLFMSFKSISLFLLFSFFLLIIVMFILNQTVQSAEWQWSSTIRNAKDNPGKSRAYLWIPPDCKQLKGVVFAQHNMEEVMILENTKFRKALEKLCLAEIWCAPAFDLFFNFDQGAGDTFNGIMEALANASGYSELKYVPVVYMGHSAAASAPYYFAAWNPKRTLAAISVSGQWPYVRNVACPDVRGDRTIDYIPSLESMGEYEAANIWSGEGLKERQQHPLMPLSMLACPAEGHFATSDKKGEYLAFYIKKAMQYRLPEKVFMDKPTPLNPVDPTRTGWLKDKWRINQAPDPATVSAYKGNAAEAFWFFDEEHVQATCKYEASFRGLKPQLVGIVQQGKMLPQNNTHLQVHPKFLPEDDGISFTLNGAFYDTVVAGSPRLPVWTGLPVGSAIGHAAGNEPISVDKICGPFIKIGSDKFVLHLDKSAIVKNNQMELVFVVTHQGDDQYKPAVQQASMMVPAQNIEGREQIITFPEIPDQKTGSKPVELHATSSAGVPVFYDVQDGPAVITGDKLTLTHIPLRAKYPVKVTVIAWQYGRSVEPKLKSALPVERIFYVMK
jgi:hypothetical protein